MSGRGWWLDVCKDHLTSKKPAVPHWDFNSIAFPDLGSFSGNHAYLASPDSTLLPGALLLPESYITDWQNKINRTEDCLYRKDRQRKQDPMLCKMHDNYEMSNCKNWVEFLELVTKNKSQQLKETPAHLWESITALTQPGQCNSHSKFFLLFLLFEQCKAIVLKL